MRSETRQEEGSIRRERPAATARPLVGRPLRNWRPLQTSGQIISDKCHRAIDLHRWQSHKVDIAAAGESDSATQREKGDHLSRPEFALDCRNGRGGRIQTDGMNTANVDHSRRGDSGRDAAGRRNIEQPRILVVLANDGDEVCTSHH